MPKLVVNLYGGPGAGKSTTAAGVFCLLKLHGVNCELITEFAKDLTWEERNKTLHNQVYILGKQQHKIWRIPDTVDVVVTDSPLLLGALYVGIDDSKLREFIFFCFNTFCNINYYLNRVKPYNPDGRRQDKKEAIGLDVSTKTLLKQWSIPYQEFPGDHNGINAITKDVLRVLEDMEDTEVKNNFHIGLLSFSDIMSSANIDDLIKS